MPAGLGAVTVAGVVLAPLLAKLLSVGVPGEIADEQQALISYLLRFFIPQVMLYAAGTVAIAVLHAKQRFAMASAAPIGNTVIMVLSLLAFRASAGPDPGFDLSSGERLWLVAAGTGGVVGFVLPLLVTCWATGFRLVPRFGRPDSRVATALRHAGWGIVLHSGAGLLLGGAIIAGAAVEGGVVAYQIGWVFFLAPYAVLAQPLQTTIFPELVREVGTGAFAASMRWALERVALLVVPVAAAIMALALPGMRAVVFGAADDASATLLAAALASLAIGLFPYSAFLLLARGFYVLGDSRTPGVASVATAVLGVAVMGIGAASTSGAARVAMLGIGHSVAYTVGAVALVVTLRRRVADSLVPRAFGRVLASAAVVGGLAWIGAREALPEGSSRVQDMAFVAAVLIVGAGAVAVLYRVLGVHRALTVRTTPAVAR
jgi:putative peptidoglycan lipid II flippase